MRSLTSPMIPGSGNPQAGIMPIGGIGWLHHGEWWHSAVGTNKHVVADVDIVAIVAIEWRSDGAARWRSAIPLRL